MMRKFGNTKGQMRLIEVILASFIIITALGFTNLLSITPTSPKYEATELEKLGYNVLHDLDKQGLLPRFIYNAEWTNVTSALRVTLPMDVYFNMTVYDSNNDNVAEGLYYGDSSTFSDANTVASITYCLSGYSIQTGPGQFEAVYDPRILILQLVRI